MDTGVDPGTAAFFVRGVLAINGHILGKGDGGGGDKAPSGRSDDITW